MGIRSFALVALLFVSATVVADELTVGFGTPGPTVLSAKLWTNEEIAYDIAVYRKSEEVYVHFDYLIHDNDKFNIDGNPMPFYYGYGARFIEHETDDTIMGLRMPIGVSYFIPDVPFEVFGELAPRIDIAPSTNFGLDFIIGVRFRINEIQRRHTAEGRRTDDRSNHSTNEGDRENGDAPPPVPNAPSDYRGY